MGRYCTRPTDPTDVAPSTSDENSEVDMRINVRGTNQVLRIRVLEVLTLRNAARLTMK